MVFISIVSGVRIHKWNGYHALLIHYIINAFEQYHNSRSYSTVVPCIMVYTFLAFNISQNQNHFSFLIAWQYWLDITEPTKSIPSNCPSKHFYMLSLIFHACLIPPARYYGLYFCTIFILWDAFLPSITISRHYWINW